MRVTEKRRVHAFSQCHLCESERTIDRNFNSAHRLAPITANATLAINRYSIMKISDQNPAYGNVSDCKIDHNIIFLYFKMTNSIFFLLLFLFVFFVCFCQGRIYLSFPSKLSALNLFSLLQHILLCVLRLQLTSLSLTAIKHVLPRVLGEFGHILILPA